MYLKKDEITFLYDSTNTRDLKTLALAGTITPKINKQDLNSVEVSPTLFELIVEMLGNDVKEIINKAEPYYQEQMSGHDYSTMMWFNALKHHPSLLKAPIAIYKDKIVVCNTPTDIFKLETDTAVNIQI